MAGFFDVLLRGLTLAFASVALGGVAWTLLVLGAEAHVKPDAALIVYSGQQGAQTEVRQALPAEWIHAFLQKPFAVEQLTGVLDGIGAAG